MLHRHLLFFSLVLTFSLTTTAQERIAERVSFSGCIDTNILGDQGIAKIISLIVDDWGNQYILSDYRGQTEYFQGDTVLYPSGTNFVGNGGTVLRKLNPAGEVIWTKPMAIEVLHTMGEDGDLPDCYGQKLAFHADGSVLMAVSMKRRGKLWYNNEVSLSNYLGDTSRVGFILAKIDTGGSVSWHHRFSLSYSLSIQDETRESIDHLSCDASGSIYMVGITSRYLSIGDTTQLIHCYTGNCSGYYPNTLVPFAIKLNSSGNYSWGNILKFRSPALGQGDEYYRKVRIEEYTSAATVDDSGNVYLSFICDYFQDTEVFFSNDTLVYPETGQYLFTAKLNSSTGQDEWFKTFPVEWSNNNYTEFKHIGKLGAIEVIGDTLYQILNPNFGTAEIQSVLIDSLDTIQEPSSGSMLGALIKQSIDNGIAYDYDLLTSPATLQHHVQESAVHDGKLWFAIHNAPSVTVNGQVFNSFAWSSKPTMIIEYDPTTNGYSEQETIIGDNVTIYSSGVAQLQLYIRSIVFSENGDLYIAGSTYAGSSFGDVSLPYQPFKKGFVTKYRNCDYLVEPLIGDNAICNGESTTLHALAHDSVSYTWKHNGFVVNGQSDSTLTTSVGGTYEVVVSDTFGCEATSPAFVVFDQSNSSLSLDVFPEELCDNDSALVLNGGSPAGGLYFGTAISGNTFNPQVSPLGSNTIYYTVTDSIGCADTVSDQIFVNASPSVYFFQSIEACEGDMVTLNGGLPGGGTYGGTYVSGNQFNTSASGDGTFPLNYSYSNAAGCTSSDTILAVVKPTPNVSLDLSIDSVCENAGLFALSGESPSGGQFSGTGVSGNFFIPTIVNPGSYAISYEVTSNGCTGVAIDTMKVDSFPQVALPGLDSVCLSAEGLLMEHAYPAGGTYYGSGVSNNAFTANAVGLGTHNLMYVYTNACASDTAYSTIDVIPSPMLSSVVTDVSCNGNNDGTIQANVTGGNGGYSYLWTGGQTTAMIDSLFAGTYTVTVAGIGGCTAADTVVVTEPTPVSLQLDSLDQVLCNGLSNGSAFITANGGTSPYGYLWNTGSTTEDLSGFGIGSYSVTVTDNNGCQDSLSFAVTEQSPISITATTVDLTCYASGDGSITTTASSGGGSFNYTWNTGPTTANLTGLDTGLYQITVSDQFGCTASDSFALDQPDSISIAMVSTNPLCYGYTDGSIASTASGGTGIITYAWSNSMTLDSISGLSAGTYGLTVSDANGCTKTSSSTLSDPDSIEVSISETRPISCAGLNDGILEAVASNGVGAYNYNWSDSTQLAINSSLIGGVYIVTVNDTNGCVGVDTYTLTEPAALNLLIDSLVEPLCDQDSNGYIAASSVGGTGVISYEWNSGETASTLTNLDSGLYNLTITDMNGCEEDTSILLSDPQEILITLNPVPVTCFDDSNGAISSTVSNAVGSPAYLWSNGATSATINALPGGMYSLTITDSNGCQAMSEVDVFEPTKLTLASWNIQENVCNGDSLASISLSANGGNGAPYNFLWSSGDTTSSIDTMHAGTYAVTITDSNSCAFDTLFNIEDPTALSITIDSIWMPVCYGDTNGFITVVGGGGNNLYNWEWNDGSTQTSRNDLGEGTYTITLMDGPQGECEKDTTISISTPNEIVIAVDTVADILCHNDSSGQIGVSVTGGVPQYNYTWNNGGDSASINGLIAGVYTLTVTDSNACAQSIEQIVSEPDMLSISASITSANCSDGADGSISIDAEGGVEPYSYVWAMGDTTSSISDLSAGNYFLTLTDSHSCELSDSFNLAFLVQTPVADLGSDTGLCPGDSIWVWAGDSGSYEWSDGTFDPQMLVTTSGTYSVTITRDSLCQSSDTITIEEYPIPAFILGNDTFICQDHLNEGILFGGPGGMSEYLWSTGDVGSDLTVTTFGTYWLEVTNTHGCLSSDTIEVVNDTCLGTGPSLSDAPWLLYPNPTRDILTIEAPSSNAKASIAIRNAAGQCVWTGTIEGRKTLIDLQRWSAGVYFIMIEHNNTIHSRRVVKQ